MKLEDLPFPFRIAMTHQAQAPDPSVICAKCANVYAEMMDKCPVCQSSLILQITPTSFNGGDKGVCRRCGQTLRPFEDDDFA